MRGGLRRRQENGAIRAEEGVAVEEAAELAVAPDPHHAVGVAVGERRAARDEVRQEEGRRAATGERGAPIVAAAVRTPGHHDATAPLVRDGGHLDAVDHARPIRVLLQEHPHRRPTLRVHEADATDLGVRGVGLHVHALRAEVGLEGVGRVPPAGAVDEQEAPPRGLRAPGAPGAGEEQAGREARARERRAGGGEREEGTASEVESHVSTPGTSGRGSWPRARSATRRRCPPPRRRWPTRP